MAGGSPQYRIAELSGLGHNGGPTMDPGFGARKHAWTQARKALLPTLPLEIVRLRVARAKRLGLDYRTYATIRATTGRDIVGFLFSGNALDLTPRRISVPDHVGVRLAALDLPDCDRLAAVYAPAHPDVIVGANQGLLDHAMPAPPFAESWSAMRDRLRATLSARNLPADGVVLVSATVVEREWCTAGKLAGIVPADVFFPRT